MGKPKILREPNDAADTRGLSQAGRAAKTGHGSAFQCLLHSLGYLWTECEPTQQGALAGPRTDWHPVYAQP